MKTRLFSIMLAMLLSPFSALAEDTITSEQIREVIAAVDRAAMNRDSQGIGEYLSENFSRDIEISTDDKKYVAHVPKEAYLDMIEQGWQKTEEYSYTRQDTTINIAQDGSSGESSSTIIETVVMDGRAMVSKIREYAQYRLEDGRAVITTVQGHTLVGDTTPQ